ncbi:uncharacterized protein ACO6RY_13067 [Pungitius sinensis]
MDDGSKQNTFGSGQPRTQHPRPFFYVQPPSQPYYLYQHWQMNNPYGAYGVPGGLNFGRPCMNPYQYMQYPGYVFPHAPIYPMDYRRMFEPRFHAPSWNDMPRHHHHHQQQQQYPYPQQYPQHQQQPQPPPPPQQPPGFRETACSEAQTDPSDAITKLIECLDKIRATELQSAERELDSGVASQSSGMFSPVEEKKKKKLKELCQVLPAVPDDADGADGRRLPESPVVTLGNSSSAAVYGGESSRRSLDGLSPQRCWSAVLEEEELPLDSSSVHEEEQADAHLLPLEKAEVAGIQSDVSAADASVPHGDAKELLRQRADPIAPSSSSSSSSPSSSSSSSSSFTSNQPGLKDAKSGVKVSQTDRSYRILKLPFQSVLAPVEAAAGCLPSPTAPYYYNYLSMQSTHERMSVLSPSLDELSSRDEMFSTDLDDADLFPKRVYAGRRLLEVGVGSPKAGDAALGEARSPGSKRSMCACCGKSLAKGTARSKGHAPKAYRDEAQRDSEEEEEEEEEEDGGRYGRGCEQPVRVVVRKHSAHRKPHAAPLRHAPKPWYKRGQEPSAPAPREEAPEGHELLPPPPPEGEAAEAAGCELQCRPCADRLCREDVTTSDQGRYGDGDVAPRRRPANLPQRQEPSAQRKATLHRARDEDEPPHWERGSTTREPRC